MSKKIVLLCLIVTTFLVYSISLDKVPVHLNQDELGFSLNAYSIGKTGFDENGRLLPFYFWHLGLMWATPVIVYITAFFLVIFPFSEITIRLPSVFIGTLNVFLIFVLATKLFSDKKFGLVTAILLASTPIHFIQSRILLDNLFPVPFVLGWMLFLYLFFSKQKIWLLFLSTFLLGLGIHSYHATKVIMPIYLFITLFLIAYKIKEKRLLFFFASILAFILPLLPLIPWLSQYPDTLTDQIRYTGLYDTKLNPVQGISTLLKPEIIVQRIIVYINYFDLEFLFLKGDASLIHSTGRTGVFLLPFIALLPVGIYSAIKNRNWFNTLLLIGFFTAPAAAALVGNEFRASKELFILPFACLLATSAIKFLLDQKKKIWKFVLVLLLLIIPVQFTYFLYDYFGSYRERSYNWFNYNIPDALEGLIANERLKPGSSIYLDDGIYFIDRYWRFYLIKHHKENLLAKTFYIDTKSFDSKTFPNGSLVLFRFDHQPINLPSKLQAVTEPDGYISFYIMRL